MTSFPRKIAILFSFGALVYLLLSDLDLFPDYHIFAPTFISKSQKFISVSRVTDTEDDDNLKLTQLLTSSQQTINTSDIQQNSLSTTTVSSPSFIPQNSSLPACPVTPSGLVGPIKVWFDEPSFEQLQHIYPFLELGGHGKPRNCLSRHRVAIILPYRDRERHLRIFLHNLHSLLTKQQIDYGIFIVEQIQNETFNRAKLLNIGFTEANKLYDWQCYVFHDVDLLPEDDRNIYSCPTQPRHMSVAIDKFKYKLPYGSIFGGITALTKEQFLTVNGFSNDYWGWGGEDDDLSTRHAFKQLLSLHGLWPETHIVYFSRVTSSGMKIMRYPINIAKYRMIKHLNEKENPLNPCRYDLMAQTKVRKEKDGLSSLEYKRHDLKLLPLYTLIKVELLEEMSRQRLREEGFRNC